MPQVRPDADRSPEEGTSGSAVFGSEVAEQPAALTRLLDSAGPDLPLPQARAVQFVGMGSSLFACTPAVYYLSSYGVEAIALDAGELYAHLDCGRSNGLLRVLVSQSGRTREVLGFAERLTERGETYVAIVNDEDSELAKLAPLVVAMKAGPEFGPSSKTYTNSVAATLLVAGMVCGRHPSVVSDLQSCVGTLHLLLSSEEAGPEEALSSVLAGEGHVDIVARGHELGTASEAALLLRETAGRKANAQSVGQLRHGPIHTLRPSDIVVVVAARGYESADQRLCDAVVSQGARAVRMDRHVRRGNHLSGWVLPMLSITGFQQAALAICRTTNRQPGAGVPKVTEPE